jgi:hypothetical protein
MKEELPKWIIDGECFKPVDVICNLGYACDGCPYRKNGELINSQLIEVEELEKEIKSTVDKYIAYTKKNNIELPKEFNNWSIITQSLYIITNHKSTKQEE